MHNLPKAALVSVVGTTAAAILISFVPKFEGVIHRGYFDPVGIATKCSGDTHDVVVGKQYSAAECWTSLNQQLLAHAEDVLRCTPDLKDHPNQLAAAVSFAYNIGGHNYCASTTAKRFNKHDWKGACRAMNEADDGRALWVTSHGTVLSGLVRRRAEERALCERGL
ncbi:lysozyme [Caballeronia sp. LZ035]|uniref:lysozyme n=1 Tax=Caballeronia sp. LZ035 TaxID=3038568 RepID=UPI0028619E92|nr:lysozyme [Caballeronia sp. LZ035]MDR5756511.1 lysozyme [Caballeronia sp. LZ035]